MRRNPRKRLTDKGLDTNTATLDRLAVPVRLFRPLLAGRQSVRLTIESSQPFEVLNLNARFGH